MIATQEQINAIVNNLTGTTGSLDNEACETCGVDYIDQIENFDKITDAVDDAIFECDQCGWWCEISEEEDGVCFDCNADNEEDEDDE